MKKFVLLLIIIFGSFALISCQSDYYGIIEKNMSDIRYTLFCLQTENACISLSCGKREKDYRYNGIKTESLNCGVLRLETNSEIKSTSIDAIILVDDEALPTTLELSPYENAFMADI